MFALLRLNHFALKHFLYSNSISETISSNFIMFLKLHVVSYIQYFHVFFCVLKENADIFMTSSSK